MTKIEAVREVLAKKPDATYSEVEGQMKSLGINANYFSVLKNTLKNGKAKSKPAKAAKQALAKKTRKARQPKVQQVVAVTLDESLAFVQTFGGVANAKTEVARLEQLLVKYEELSQEIDKAGGVTAIQGNLARQREMLTRFTALADVVKQVA
jgi:hypothetical protein